jgi:Protein of unknown function (DUF1501)
MNLSRRSLLLGGLGLTQAALLTRGGVRAGVRNALAAGSGGPSKIVTIFVPGGWMPSLFFPPFSNDLINRRIRDEIGKEGSLIGGSGYPRAGVFFGADAVINPETGANTDPGPNAKSQPLRVARLWNPSNPKDATGSLADYNGGYLYNPHGYGWVREKLYAKTCVIHGIDQGTAAHDSGRIASICGVAGSQYRAPAVGAVVAHALYAKYKDSRPLPSVALSAALSPNPFNLPSYVNSTFLGNPAAVALDLSESNEAAWKDLRGRKENLVQPFAGTNPAQPVKLTDMDAYLLEQTLALKGKSSAGTDEFYGKVYDGLANTSKLLASDVVGTLSGLPKTKVDYGYGNDVNWSHPFDNALRLLRSDLCTSITMEIRGPSGLPGKLGVYFDTHAELFGSHLDSLRRTFEAISMFLGELDQTPNSSGTGSLLDETLVYVCSEFSRTFSANGHWPTTSSVLVGGGVNGNLMIGNYDLGAAVDPIGVPIPILDDKGGYSDAIPKPADVLATIYKTFGIKDFFIPGGYGDIQGVIKT